MCLIYLLQHSLDAFCHSEHCDGFPCCLISTLIYCKFHFYHIPATNKVFSHTPMAYNNLFALTSKNAHFCLNVIVLSTPTKILKTSTDNLVSFNNTKSHSLNAPRKQFCTLISQVLDSMQLKC